MLAGTSKGMVLGPFQVLAPVGRGGMSVVYLARDSRDQRLVALKLLPPKKARREERLQARFLREMDLCRRVAHPHIARTFEVGKERGVLYIAMEFIPGRDLSRLVQEAGSLPVPRAARLFAEVASGLQHAHEQGLIHRDLKPSNIRVTPNDRVIILDLGLALLEGEEAGDKEIMGGQGYVVGSMDYIAPEQTYDPCGVDGRADIYGLGCSLYFTLTGKPPFPGGTAKEKIQRHRNEEPALLTERNPTVPPRFGELVHRMLVKDPNRRCGPIAVVRQELLAWAAPEPVKLDARDDSIFREAVASLQAADATDDLEVLPSVEPPAPQGLPVAFWVVGAVILWGCCWPWY